MPIYAYRCDACGFSKDVLQKVDDAPLVDCPECSAPAMKKQVTSAGFHLKGSGWYQTDFRNSGSAPAAKTAEAANGAGGKSDDKAKSGGDKTAGVESSGSASAAAPAAGGGSAAVDKPAACAPGFGCH